MPIAPFAAVGLIFLVAIPVRSQVTWDGPLLISPETPQGWSAFLVDPSEGSGIGFLGTWRGGGPVGYRVGLAEAETHHHHHVDDLHHDHHELSVFGGVDFSSRMVDASDDFPLHVSWVAGAGLGVGDDFIVSFPLGISLGRGFQAESVVFRPYLTPRLVLDAHFRQGHSDHHGEDDLNLGLALDFGLDIAFDPGWEVRFGVSLGERDALAIGASFREF